MPIQARQVQSNKLEIIQILRAFAALLVVVDHSLLTLIDRVSLDVWFREFAVAAGGFGVSLFFAISGFIMVYTTYDKPRGAIAGWRFMLNRILRVVPLYWLCSTIYLLKCLVEGKSFTMTEILKSYLFVPYLNPDGKFQPFYGLGWTLNYEMFFYLFFAATIMFSSRVASSLVFCAAFGLLFVFTDFAARQGVELPDPVVFWGLPIILYFVFGVLIGLAYYKWPSTQRLAVSSVSVIVILGAAFLALMTTAVASGLVEEVVAPVLIAILMIVAVFGRVSNPEQRFWSAASKIGDASFSIYLTHSFILGPVGRAWGLIGLDARHWLLFCVACAILSIIVGLAMYKYVERPLGARLKKTFL
ncbi:Peptidoglycan/LPS O-acetylase OafA/YrhL, contains acyltransferase and SGNH-hydrolase domains [Rhizobium sp. RU36D]|nr:Peptidoglycan/LPS O-acetylase OafA/YrhL, contains acyltransferase and SGNH-hydrolase domains [Rhizobium sp. RU36D]